MPSLEVAYVWYADRHVLVGGRPAWSGSASCQRQTIVWVKPYGVISRTHYNWTSTSRAGTPSKAGATADGSGDTRPDDGLAGAP